MRLLLISFLILRFSRAAEDPETNMTAVEIIRYWGYPAESYDVYTEDGYILDMFRIPYGRNADQNSSCARPVILMAHGLGSCGVQYVLNPPDSAPAFLLADAGFDVFILNQRGTTYGKRHLKLKPTDNRFWQFTLDEFAKYDIPAFIDKALSVSGQSSLYWIGHSQGTLVGWLTLADKPEYNQKVKMLFQMAPATTASHSRGAMRVAYPAYERLKNVADTYRYMLGSHEVVMGVSPILRPLSQLCSAIPFIGPEVCRAFNFFSSGPPSKHLNLSRLPVYLSHVPCGSSTWNFLHWIQMASHKRVEHMDHNTAENLRRYGQKTPPPYDFGRIESPSFLFWSRNDWMATPRDIEDNVYPYLRKGALKGTIEVPEYNHLDFSISTDVKEKVFNPIARIVRELESNMCQ